MSRATNSPASRARRKRVLNKAKGYRGFRSTHYRYAKDAVRKAMTYAFRDRKVRKRLFRRLWTQRINSVTRTLGLSYSRFMEGMKAASIEIDRKVLSDLAITDSAAFAAIVEKAKAALGQKREAAKTAA
ncbi:MAG: rplt bact: ribosomal protein bl20 [Verrucomicrobiaceae bacterium]|nr:rplt bact: ribosomal protein bl20 [Verrucomicrobiaceae bacterium]MDB6117462.1 rplt bact: ribosomal protein bl20 [Verrucomicrobiaceae bacterium]